ncbi:MAG: hypothetical protein HETSPECPRED_001111 [Heterodermia speciosa]|uniref:Rhodopsin domain-containing protein n=1 Tax=Heterodermia speciosa TaxID=116794 RepID=A0A8H3J0R0_9LECA|nr:MAG: hypothetical protein HETSPECPRED_001111 [Heterodermia speciosa]
MAMIAEPHGGDLNRAAEIYGFTWSLEIISLFFVVSRMYSRIKLTRNVWWDDWLVCIAFTLDFIISVMWSVYAGRGYARHLYYIPTNQIPDIIKLNTISRAMCMFSISVGKISVALLIERIAGPSRWRKWLLRSISVSVFITAVITLTLFFAQCSPARAVWDKALVKEGKAECWNPLPINTWNLTVASYWAFLDFALACIPIDMIWKLQLSLKKKFLLICLLGMGVFAGICASVKTSKIPISVKAQRDITWQTVELLMWNGIEMNVIIIAACIPTLRPLFLIICKRATASDFLSQRRQSSYHKHPSSSSDPNKSSNQHPPTIGSRGSKAFDKYPITRELTRTSIDSQKSLSSKKARTSKNSILVEETICVETRELHSSDGSRGASEETKEWGVSTPRGRAATAVPLSEIGKPSPPRSRERAVTVGTEDGGEGVKGADMV